MTWGKRLLRTKSPARISGSQTPMPAVSSRMRTWFGFGFGTESDRTRNTSGPPKRSIAAAFIVSGIAVSMVAASSVPRKYVAGSAREHGGCRFSLLRPQRDSNAGSACYSASYLKANLLGSGHAWPIAQSRDAVPVALVSCASTEPLPARKPVVAERAFAPSPECNPRLFSRLDTPVRAGSACRFAPRPVRPTRYARDPTSAMRT